MDSDSNTNTKVEIPKKPGRGGKREKLVIDELLTRQIASLISLGMPYTEIARQVNIGHDMVSKIAKRADVKALVREVGESALSTAKAQIRLETSRMVSKIMEVIHDNLDKGSLEAVKIGLKILGFSEESVSPTQATQFTVVMPGAKDPTKTAIEVPNVTEDEPSGNSPDQEL